MAVERLPLLLLFLAFAILPLSATDGMFQGKIVEPPANQPATGGWIYVEGRNHALRRVEVSHAAIAFGSEVPSDQRRKCGMECLIPGQEVRVIAEQDSSGEWRAKKIEILKLVTRRDMTRRVLMELEPFCGRERSGSPQAKS